MLSPASGALSLALLFLGAAAAAAAGGEGGALRWGALCVGVGVSVGGLAGPRRLNCIMRLSVL